MIERLARAVAFANGWDASEEGGGLALSVPLPDGTRRAVVVVAETDARGKPVARLFAPVRPAAGADAASCLRMNAEAGEGSLAVRGADLVLTASRAAPELDPARARNLFTDLAARAVELAKKLG